MKIRIELKPEILQHLRKRKELSLKEAAECLRKRSNQDGRSLLNMYHRIEKTGVTSPATAALIARKLDVSVAQLQGDPMPDEFLWWVVGPGFENQGTLLLGYIGVARRLQSMVEPWRDLQNVCTVECTLTVSSKYCELSLSASGDSPYPPESIMFQPARRAEHGIEWIELTEHDRAHWETTLFEIVHDACDVASFNGRPIPPNTAKPGYLLITGPGPRPDFERANRRFYPTEAGLLNALVRKLVSSPDRRVYRGGIGSRFLFLHINSFTHAITRAYREGAQGEIHGCCWRHVHALGLEERLEQALRRSTADVIFS